MVAPGGASVGVIGEVNDVLVGVVGVGVKIGATAMSGSSPPPLSMVNGNTASTTTTTPALTRATTRGRSWASVPPSPVGRLPGLRLDDCVVVPSHSVSNVASQ